MTSRAKAKGLEFRNGAWWVKLAVPVDVRPVIGKSTFLKNLKTDDVLVARQASEPIMAGWRVMITEARAGASPEAIEAKAKAWAEGQRYARPQGLMSSELLAEFGIKSAQPDQYLDVQTAALFRAGLSSVAAIVPEASRPVLDRLAGQDVALRTAIAEKAAQVAAAHYADLKSADLETKAFGSPNPRADGPKPISITGTTLASLFDLFVDANPKRHATMIARNRQYLRRLGEFMGDGDQTDIGLVTKAKVTAFWSDLKFFPARRNQQQGRQAFGKVIAAQKRAKGTDAFQQTQSDETLAAWLGFYRQLFALAVKHDLIAVDPWVVVTHKVDKSELKGKPYSADDLKKVFGGALFKGHQFNDKWRVKLGDVVIRDAKFWMPIIALFTGTRMSEVAASPLDAVTEIEGIWCLDLTTRAVSFESDGPRVKNKASRRLVPIHSELIRLGFIQYVQQRQQAGDKWLFPDMDHDSRHGPRHAFSKWWGSRQQKIGVDRTFHDLRHTWKRAAREAGIGEERSDLLSGHSNGSMGRKYGAGLDVKLLKDEMDKISFADFPL